MNSDLELIMSRKGRELMKQQWQQDWSTLSFCSFPLSTEGYEGNDDEEAYQAVQKLAAASVQ